LLRLLITESCVLTMAGAAAGIGLANVSVEALTAASPVTFPSFVQPGINITVLAFTVAVAGLCGVLLGLAPAMHVRWAKLADTLKETARGSTGVRSQRLRAGLVVAEVALAIVLLIGAGLMIRSVQKLTAIDPGFQADGLLTLNASIPRLPAPAPAVPPVPGTPPPAPPPLVVSADALLAQIRAVPGVTSASLASDLPLGSASSAVFYSAEGDTTTGAQTMPRAYVHRVTPEFFDTMGMTLKAGRTFQPSEAIPDGTSVIVSEGVPRRFWPNQDPIGKRIKIGAVSSPNPWLTIVGVTGEVKYRGLPANPTADPDLYFPALDRAVQGVLLRTSIDPSSVTAAVRAAIRRAHPSIVVYNISAMADLVKAQTAASAFTTWILSLFAATALVLSVVGIYGVMSFLVSQRTREFGIRLALGASRGELVGVVMRQGTRLIAIGAVLGVAGSLGLSTLIGDLLYGVTALDVASAMAILILVVVALLACAVPALRATRVDPVIALRNE
jgi:predicted permease